MNSVVHEHTFDSRQTLQIVQGDITEENVDAIVNAANCWLQHGGGVAGAIVKKGGRIIQQESDSWVQKHGKVGHEQPAYTTAGTLPCKYVIHAVGPIWGSGDEESKLALAVSGALTLAENLKLEMIAMPPISTGIFGFPKEIAAPIFFEQVAAFFITHLKSSLQLVRLTILDNATLQVFIPAFTSWIKLQPPKVEEKS